MNDKLSGFLVDLASDPDRMARFLADPHGLLAGVDLTGDQKAAVLSRDSRRLAAALGAGSKSNGNVQNLSIGNVQNVTIGNVQNVTIGNVQNITGQPKGKGPKKTVTKPAKKPGSKKK